MSFNLIQPLEIRAFWIIVPSSSIHDANHGPLNINDAAGLSPEEMQSLQHAVKIAPLHDAAFPHALLLTSNALQFFWHGNTMVLYHVLYS